jgi:hypothetical protein
MDDVVACMIATADEQLAAVAVAFGITLVAG